MVIAADTEFFLADLELWVGWVAHEDIRMPMRI